MRSLSTKLTVWYIAALSGLLIVSFAAMFFGIDRVFDYQIKSDLEEDIEEFRGYLDEEGTERVIVEIEREVQGADLRREFMRLYDSNGKLVFSSDVSSYVTPFEGLENPNRLLNGGIILAASDRVIREDDGEDEIEFREIAGFIGDGLIIHLGESTEEKEEIMETLLHSFIVVFLIILPLSGFVGWMVSRKAVRGIKEVSQVAAKIHRGQLDDRVTISASEKEIVDLSMTFNSMLDRIKDLVSEMREMMDNIAHDLKSPLARIRIISEEQILSGETPDISRQAARNTINECDRLLKMINDSLDLAEAEVGIGINGKEKIDLSHLASEACELFRPVAEQKNIKLVSGIEEGCTYRGVEHVLQRAIANLIDNAIKYTDEGGEVRLMLTREGNEIFIRIADTGVGISESDQKKVFNRFFRCDSSRSKEGSGLGLNYSRAVVRALGGEISLISRENRGSEFIMNLPVAQLT